ncbi:MAG: phosphate acyltransferase [Gemmataceae bacterium]
MSLSSFDDLFRLADQLTQPVPVAVAGGADDTVLEALREAVERGWVAPALAGPEADVRRLAAERGIDLRGFRLVDTEEPAPAAVAEVRQGRAALLMKGQIATPALMKAVLDPAFGLRTGGTICQIVLMEIGPTNRRFLLADTGLCIQPTLEQKADILRGTVAVARQLEAAEPRVAVLAATESPTDAMPETLEAAELQRRQQAGEFPGCRVRGPLSFDLAYAEEAAARKRLHDPDFGAADVMLFPNLLAANLTVKAIMYTADCRFGGILWGASCPVVFMSRADSSATRLRSLALALRCGSFSKRG